MLTSHDKPALLVLDVEYGLRILSGMELLTQLLLAHNLTEAARAITADAAIGLSHDHDWIKCTLDDLRQAEDASTKIRTLERSPRE